MAVFRQKKRIKAQSEAVRIERLGRLHAKIPQNFIRESNSHQNNRTAKQAGTKTEHEQKYSYEQQLTEIFFSQLLIRAASYIFENTTGGIFP